jgi:hypothetical protein
LIEQQRAADAFERGEEPQRQQQPRIDRGAAGAARHGANLDVLRAEIERLAKLPDGAGQVFGRQQGIQRRRTPLDLIPLRALLYRAPRPAERDGEVLIRSP